MGVSFICSRETKQGEQRSFHNINDDFIDYLAVTTKTKSIIICTITRHSVIGRLCMDNNDAIEGIKIY